MGVMSSRGRKCRKIEKEGKTIKYRGQERREMGKGSIAVLFLVIMAVIAIGVVIVGVNSDGEERVRLGLSFGATILLICFVFFLALYLGHIRTRGMYIVA